jgi:hypothetical protein
MKENRNNTVELVFILDRSGSMAPLVSDTVGGFNGMIAQQKKEQAGEVLVTTYLFANSAELLHDRIPIAEIGEMTDREYSVGGCTALLDCVGEAIGHIESIHRYARPEDVPGHTMFIITTDGMENASRKFSYAEIKKLISRHKETGWEFIFVGANIDAPEFAEQIGIGRERAANYSASASGTARLFRAMAAPITAMRMGSSMDAAMECAAETLAEED